ncbi:MAG: hypothetical protein ACW975_10905 [Candidatus Thorarchaeota archaeon]|jgi:hypothetical protein
MKELLYRLIGKGLGIFGILMFLFFSYGTYVVITYTAEYGSMQPGMIFIPVFALLGLSMIGTGLMILRRFEEKTPNFTKIGEPIHSGRTWKRGSESGLFATSCGLVVSTNQESRETAHVGYRIVYPDHATCRDCVQRVGKEIIEQSLRRSY